MFYDVRLVIATALLSLYLETRLNVAFTSKKSFSMLVLAVFANDAGISLAILMYKSNMTSFPAPKSEVNGTHYRL